jgi:hypothetical protein
LATFEQLLVVMRNNLMAAREGNLTLARKKWDWGTVIDYVGSRICGGSVSPSAEKVQAIREMEPPKNVAKLRTVIGMINMFHRWLPDCSQSTTQMRTLM